MAERAEYVDYWNNNTYEDGCSQAVADHFNGRDADPSVKGYSFQSGYKNMTKRLTEREKEN